MTDYQPLLARALKGLPNNNSEARRGVYDRARQALLNQLRSVNPPLADSDITRERLALEDAIRKTETEAVKADPHAVRAPRPPAARSSAPIGPAEAPAAEKPAAAPAATAPAAPPNTPPKTPPNTAAAAAASKPVPADKPSVTADSPEKPVAPAAKPVPPHPPAPPAAAAPHGSAPAARKAPPQAGAPRPPARPAAPPRPTAANGTRPPLRGAGPGEHAPRNGMRPPRDPHAPPPPGLARRFERGRKAATQNAAAEVSPEDFEAARQQAPQAAGGNKRGRILVAGFVVLLLAVAGSLGYMHRDRILALVGAGGGSTPQVASSEQPKSSERIAPAPEANQGSQSPAPSTVDPAVAQRAVLYEENPGGGQQFQNFVGTAVWKTETVTLGAGRAPDLGLRVDVEIPDRHMSAVITLRRNVDPSFPASHTIEVRFSTPNDPFGGVTDMRGMRAKSTETAQGTPLAAVVQKVKEGYFLLALPNIEEDNNLAMLRDRDWLDVPLVYSNGRRAVLTFQKGTPGERAVNEAFLSWGKGG